MNLYQDFLFPLVCQADAEWVHETTLHWMGKGALAAPLRAAFASASRLDTDVLSSVVAGLSFKSPIGLAAGFDKNASAIPLFESLGFSAIEVGTVTPLPQPGNPRPRIIRFPKDKALINRMGFPSDGADVVAKRLADYRARAAGRKGTPVIGVNIGKMKSTSVEDAALDYVSCFQKLKGLGDYVVLNVSSPNTPELRRLQEPARLRDLFSALQSENSASVPLFVKIAPDLSDADLSELLAVCLESRISGVLATNTTLSREGLSEETSEVGGLSGAPLFERSLSFVERVWQRSEGQFPIIGVGGISSVEHALKFIGAGASLLQIYTGLVYKGPMLVRDLHRGLIRAVRLAGCKSISELVGRGAREVSRLASGNGVSGIVAAGSGAAGNGASGIGASSSGAL